ncbi:MAG: spheroidene monooxygenase [candidate division KSB1 bacterium]|nr:spheroidene monooxygenase [candidate division KSB1 bacterium]MDZ7368925.1 spheroidene monooxygenase [candidate division KSB1 bacterium]MDZ7406913.1 spheroidene monooxygenase [candidate division KSB1 bacterium]
MTTLTLFGYSGAEKIWAFAQMAFGRPKLRRVTGLRFWKLLGSGRGRGFSLRPNWSRYGLLAVWENVEALENFFAHSSFMRRYRRHADEIWTVRLLPIEVRGAWSGVKPFSPLAPQPQTGPIAILTRATIRWRRLRAFWSAVPAASQPLEQAAGLLASIGIGEAPFFRQATFSLWRNIDDMQAFAYRTNGHREAMRRTRAENWYREELFGRFVPVASEGRWEGRDPLEGIL